MFHLEATLIEIYCLIFPEKILKIDCYLANYIDPNNYILRWLLFLVLTNFYAHKGSYGLELKKKKYPPSFKPLSHFCPLANSFPSKQHGVFGIER